MKFYSITLPNVTPIGLVTAKASYGIGLLTYIVSSFCALFGISCNMFTGKLEKAEALAMEKLAANAKALGADGVMDVRCQIDGLSFLVSGTAYALSAEEKAKRLAALKAQLAAVEKAKSTVVKQAAETTAKLRQEATPDGEEETIYEQHVCNTEQELKAYIEKILEEKSRPKELLDLYWQFKKYVYGFYPEKDTKAALEKVIKECASNEFEGNSKLMISIAKNKIARL